MNWHSSHFLGAWQEEQLRWTASRSAGAWFRTVHSTLRKVHSTKFLKELTISMWQAAPCSLGEPWVQRDADLLNAAWKVILELAAARTSSEAAAGSA